jgi:hypothetical protein
MATQVSVPDWPAVDPRWAVLSAADSGGDLDKGEAWLEDAGAQAAFVDLMIELGQWPEGCAEEPPPSPALVAHPLRDGRLRCRLQTRRARRSSAGRRARSRSSDDADPEPPGSAETQPPSRSDAERLAGSPRYRPLLVFSPGALSRREAAAFCGISLRTFDLRVQPNVPRINIGRRVLFHREDLIKWQEVTKVGSSWSIEEPASGSSGSRIRDAALTSRRASEILAELRRRRR